MSTAAGDMSGQVRSAPARLHGVAFAVWAFSLAVGVLIHEWQRAQAPLSLTGLTVVLAIGVLLRPWSVPRAVALLASFGLELLIYLPDVFNHTLVVGVVGTTLVIWWLLVLRRSPADARDPHYVYASIAPYLRVAFVVVLYSAALAKLNTGFLDPVTTCAIWILDAIPLVAIPTALAPLMIAGAIVVEFAIPTLLLFRQTRFLAVLIGIGFGVITAAAGHAPFAGFGWSFYTLFISPWTLGRVMVTVRRRIPPQVRRELMNVAASPTGWIGVGVLGLVMMALVQLAPDTVIALAKRYGASLAFSLWSLVWLVPLLANWRHWFRPPRVDVATFGAGHVVLALSLVLVLVNAASPYLGLKTRFSFTMFSNLQTEPGRWNHVVVPEAVRIFELQQGVVRFDEMSDPRLAADVTAYSGPKRTSSGAATADYASMVLLAARRLASNYPDATVRYELDGQPHLASPVASDPILGGSVPFFVQKLGGFRPLDTEDTCQL